MLIALHFAIDGLNVSLELLCTQRDKKSFFPCSQASTTKSRSKPGTCRQVLFGMKTPTHFPKWGMSVRQASCGFWGLQTRVLLFTLSPDFMFFNLPPCSFSRPFGSRNYPYNGKVSGVLLQPFYCSYFESEGLKCHQLGAEILHEFQIGMYLYIPIFPAYQHYLRFAVVHHHYHPMLLVVLWDQYKLICTIFPQKLFSCLLHRMEIKGVPVILIVPGRCNTST